MFTIHEYCHVTSPVGFLKVHYTNHQITRSYNFFDKCGSLYWGDIFQPPSIVCISIFNHHLHNFTCYNLQFIIMDLCVQLPWTACIHLPLTSVNCGYSYFQATQGLIMVVIHFGHNGPNLCITPIAGLQLLLDSHKYFCPLGYEPFGLALI